jgi:hypothetical protein
VPEATVVPAPIASTYGVATNAEGDSRARSNGRLGSWVGNWSSGAGWEAGPREVGGSFTLGSWVLASPSGGGCP